MKSVQIMLFTLLGHRLEREHGWKGAIEFVHAGVKTRGAEEAAEEAKEDVGNTETSAETTADEGKAYRSRKKTAEAETEAALAGNTVWLPWFKGRSKKSDLADAFLMALRK
jgi:hypothetical protein